MNFPKNSSNHELRSNPVELARVCAKPTCVEMCESDKIFMTSIRGCVIVWVWGEDERVRKIWGARRMWAQDWCGAPDLRGFWGRVEIIWEDLR
ncbi:hypothetical protein GECvBN5_gp025 [Salmonella phage GEC_vB_N5]|uniref:Uncharacterized protein n=1 Tax=Salmonella phage GEC_vB_N5 TaxID=2777378 RepID=A0A7S9XF12_9CAUD|nr:hypothetical protein GECvBN5_gp025 [Salmonella phage GEC_vB_N5]